MKRGLVGLLIAAVVTTVVFLIADRVAGNYYYEFEKKQKLAVNKESYRPHQEEQKIRVAHPTYHPDLKPSEHRSALWGRRKYNLLTNTLGFRDASTRPIPLASERHRVLFIGDSFYRRPRHSI